MEKFEMLHHTADAKFRAYGKSLEEAFSNAALATFEVMTKTKLIKPELTMHVDISSKNLRELLYDFIQDLVIMVDVEGFILNKVKSMKISGSEKEGWKLSAVLRGDHYEKYDVHSPIKAMTYSDIEIKKTKEGYMLQVVVDI